MKINKIILSNFGSYEGNNLIDTSCDKTRNIVLIGGKNGAGKTTLFTAIRVCLYGYMSMGYKNANSYYTRAITKLINNTAKRSRPCNASVSLEIIMTNGRGVDKYNLCRSWVLEDSLTEAFTIEKNCLPLSSDEIADFEKYIVSIIPPELFNLYFFDGEKIADFFLNEGSNVRIRDAFLTLCGYDTFDIMRRNFRRISTSLKGKNNSSLSAYIEANERAQAEKHKLDELQSRLSICSSDIENCTSEIAALDRDYTIKGGITQEEWNDKLFQIKEEERKRETWNSVLRRWANDIVPFIMIKPLLEKLKKQIDLENADNKYRSFVEILSNDEISKLIGDKKATIIRAAKAKFGNSEDHILDLSFEQSASLMATITELLAFEQEKVAKCKRLIKQSIAKTTALRKELENSNISSVQEYMQSRAALFEKKSELLNLRLILEQDLQKQKELVASAEADLGRAQAALETEIKNASIGDISARAIVMLDKLQKTLYLRQIEKVESAFRKSINTLMRKERFIDDIHIDEAFNIHVYRMEEMDGNTLLDIVASNTEEQFVAMFGIAAKEKVRNTFGNIAFGNKQMTFPYSAAIQLPVEIDKSSFSNGEKQIFIMALYYSLVQLGNHEVPFVIDTPFARIDTEHRQNIATHFFSELKGQVFILSTNEEITAEHVHILKEKIAVKYTLDNTDNKQTVVLKDTYFEV